MSDDRRKNTWIDRFASLFSGEDDHLTQLADLVKAAREQNLIDADALFMIEGVLGVSEMRVRDAMIPRGQMVCVNESDSLEEALNLMLEASHSRYPVVSAEDNEVKGIVLAKDVLKAFVSKQLNSKQDLEMLYRTPVVVPESKRLNVLLREFRSSRNHMAVVVDEYGELAGLITIEDVLEEIVGEIADEHDEEETDNIHKHIHGGYAVEAITPVEEFNSFFKVDIENGLVETMGGVVTQSLGRIPAEGEKFDLFEFQFEVTKADERRIECFRIQPLTLNSDSLEPAPNLTTDIID